MSWGNPTTRLDVPGVASTASSESSNAVAEDRSIARCSTGIAAKSSVASLHTRPTFKFVNGRKPDARTPFRANKLSLLTGIGVVSFGKKNRRSSTRVSPMTWSAVRINRPRSQRTSVPVPSPAHLCSPLPVTIANVLLRATSSIASAAAVVLSSIGLSDITLGRWGIATVPPARSVSGTLSPIPHASRCLQAWS